MDGIRYLCSHYDDSDAILDVTFFDMKHILMLHESKERNVNEVLCCDFTGRPSARVSQAYYEPGRRGWSLLQFLGLGDGDTLF